MKRKKEVGAKIKMQRGEKSSGEVDSTNSNSSDEPPDQLASKSKGQRTLGISLWICNFANLVRFRGILPSVVFPACRSTVLCDVGNRS